MSHDEATSDRAVRPSAAARFPDVEVEAAVLEPDELERRWEAARREIASLLERLRDIRLASGPLELSDEQRELFKQMLNQALLPEPGSALKQSVARRMASKISQRFLGMRLPSIPAVHEMGALLPWWASHLPSDAIAALRDIGCRYLFNGAVLPVQLVWRDLLLSHQTFVGHCVCRSAGIANDLRKRGEIFLLQSEDHQRLLLDRFVLRYRALVREHGRLPDTADRYQSLLAELSRLRAKGSKHYRLERLIEATHPDWELLPVNDHYSPHWIRSLHSNRKVWPLHRELAFALATILYLARGVTFTAMRLLDTPYSICSCPTPENGGGCVLTNWYYFARSNASLLPNEQAHGRRRDHQGKVLPCRVFPVRGRRDCLGCGCDFTRAHPRGVKSTLAEADRYYQRCRRPAP